jgi:hypothetical protein
MMRGRRITNERIHWLLSVSLKRSGIQPGVVHRTRGNPLVGTGGAQRRALCFHASSIHSNAHSLVRYDPSYQLYLPVTEPEISTDLA